MTDESVVGGDGEQSNSFKLFYDDGGLCPLPAYPYYNKISEKEEEKKKPQKIVNEKRERGGSRRGEGGWGGGAPGGLGQGGRLGRERGGVGGQGGRPGRERGVAGDGVGVGRGYGRWRRVIVGVGGQVAGDSGNVTGDGGKVASNGEDKDVKVYMR
ncbi:hypothetical protein TIFTF001_014916 [Ficus carica]|uniref:Uncharacterized protein n=1 Tax=Ficus carica TaxID=3494 RepID=A0AA88A0B2_FICCA|nr:hypothetical protein TIFTF001_014916 [Ficus carica]